MMSMPGTPYPDIPVRDDQTVIRIANKTEDFCDVFNYRSKAVFSLFGSTQGEWAKIPQLNDGFPDWLMQDCPTDAAFLKMPCKKYWKHMTEKPPELQHHRQGYFCTR